jgi:hypothetical protein
MPSRVEKSAAAFSQEYDRCRTIPRAATWWMGDILGISQPEDVDANAILFRPTRQDL